MKNEEELKRLDNSVGVVDLNRIHWAFAVGTNVVPANLPANNVAYRAKRFPRVSRRFSSAKLKAGIRVKILRVRLLLLRNHFRKLLLQIEIIFEDFKILFLNFKLRRLYRACQAHNLVDDFHVLPVFHPRSKVLDKINNFLYRTHSSKSIKLTPNNP